MRTRRQLTPVLPFICALLVAPLQAAQWSLDPRIDAKAGYNDNLRLTVDDEMSSPELAFNPSATFSYKTPTSGIDGTAGLLFRHYPEEEDLDDNNATLNVDSYLLRERSRADLNVNVTRDTTLDTELEETGLAFERINRLRASIAPAWSHRFSERTSASLTYKYSIVDYDEKDAGFFDFTSSSGQLSLSRVINERSTVSVSAGHTFTDNDNNVTSQYSYLQGGASYRFSETLSLSLFAGVNRSTSEFTRQSVVPVFSGNVLIGFIALAEDEETSNDGIVYSGSVTKNFLRGNMSLTANRNVSNSISGALVEVTRFGFNSLYRLSETLSGELALSYTSTETTNEVGNALNRDYYQALPSLTWQFKKFWSISASYRYREQAFGSSRDSAVQNAAYLTLNYNWPRIAVSR